jgi:hypothetical protein
LLRACLSLQCMQPTCWSQRMACHCCGSQVACHSGHRAE